MLWSLKRHFCQKCHLEKKVLKRSISENNFKAVKVKYSIYTEHHTVGGEQISSFLQMYDFHFSR